MEPTPMKIPRTAPWLLLLLLAPLLVAGCPPEPADDDAEPATPEPRRESAAVAQALQWPGEEDEVERVDVVVTDICPAMDADLAVARQAWLDGHIVEAPELLQALVDGDGAAADGSSHLMLATLAAADGDHEAVVTLLTDPAVVDGPLAGEAALLLGRALEALERGEEAEEAYAAVPPGSRLYDTARVRVAAIALDAERPDDAITALLPLLADPAEVGSRWRAEGLLLLSRAWRARGDEGDTDRAYRALVAAWSIAPLADVADAVATEMEALADEVDPALHPTWRDELARAAAYHQAGHWNSTVKTLEAIEDELPADDPLITCETAYIWGRSLHKRRKYTESRSHLRTASDACADVEREYAVKATYMLAQGLDRTDDDSDAIAAWKQLPERFAEHTYADDGYYKAAMMERDRDRPDAARELLEALVAQFPEGDMHGEALWQLAWASYRDGDADTARAHLRLAQEHFEQSRDRKSYLRARYWEAKVIGWPDGEGAVVERTEEAPGPDPDLERAAELFEALADEHPLSWYGALAHARLQAIAPQRAEVVRARVEERRATVASRPALPEVWSVDRRFWGRPQLEATLTLACDGLRDEALAELRRARATAEPWDWQTEQLIAHIAALADDPHTSHNTLRVRFRTDHPEQLSEGSWSVMHLAYPRAYHAEVRGAVAGKDVPPLLFQALVREESAFQTRVTSWAGDMGLSQLMWATAKDTARKMGIKGLRKQDLADPTVNLAIGAHYLHLMVNTFDGNLPCAVGSYNAGPGAMGRWLRERSGYPLDEFVEDVPYKETRNYIKRVFESYQTYHQLAVGAPAFVELPLEVPVRD